MAESSPGLLDCRWVKRLPGVTIQIGPADLNTIRTWHV